MTLEEFTNTPARDVCTKVLMNRRMDDLIQLLILDPREAKQCIGGFEESIIDVPFDNSAEFLFYSSVMNYIKAPHGIFNWKFIGFASNKRNIIEQFNDIVDKFDKEPFVLDWVCLLHLIGEFYRDPSLYEDSIYSMRYIEFRMSKYTSLNIDELLHQMPLDYKVNKARELLHLETVMRLEPAYDVLLDYAGMHYTRAQRELVLDLLFQRCKTLYNAEDFARYVKDIPDAIAYRKKIASKIKVTDKDKYLALVDKGVIDPKEWRNKLWQKK